MLSIISKLYAPSLFERGPIHSIAIAPLRSLGVYYFEFESDLSLTPDAKSDAENLPPTLISHCYARCVATLLDTASKNDNCDNKAEHGNDTHEPCLCHLVRYIRGLRVRIGDMAHSKPGNRRTIFRRRLQLVQGYRVGLVLLRPPNIDNTKHQNQCDGDDDHACRYPPIQLEHRPETIEQHVHSFKVLVHLITFQ